MSRLTAGTSRPTQRGIRSERTRLTSRSPGLRLRRAPGTSSEKRQRTTITRSRRRTVQGRKRSRDISRRVVVAIATRRQAAGSRGLSVSPVCSPEFDDALKPNCAQRAPPVRRRRRANQASFSRTRSTLPAGRRARTRRFTECTRPGITGGPAPARARGSLLGRRVPVDRRSAALSTPSLQLLGVVDRELLQVLGTMRHNVGLPRFLLAHKGFSFERFLSLDGAVERRIDCWVDWFLVVGHCSMIARRYERSLPKCPSTNDTGLSAVMIGLTLLLNSTRPPRTALTGETGLMAGSRDGFC